MSNVVEPTESSANPGTGRRAKDGEPRARNPELTRQQILRAARDEFCERGLAGARVDAIAERAGANKRLLYHYFGNKEALYSTVLEAAYREIRDGEKELNLDRFGAEEAMDRLVRFTFRHFMEKPWFIRLLTTENLNKAEYLKQIPGIQSLHSPLIGLIRELVERGVAEGVFRRDVDPVQLYISIAALGYFYVSNIHTLSFIFGKDLSSITEVQDREAHAVAMVLDHLRGCPPIRANGP